MNPIRHNLNEQSASLKIVASSGLTLEVEHQGGRGVKKPLVLACQHGARRRYAVPRMLEQAGVLAALYTDSSRHSPLGKCAALFGERAPKVMRRLAGREIKGIPPEKIFSSDAYNLYEMGQALLGTQKTGILRLQQRYEMVSKTMKKWGLQGADVVYTMYHENLDFVRWAKAQGAVIVVDVFIGPQTYAVLAEEAAAFPDWYECPDERVVHEDDRMWREVAELADVLICPSEWVAEGVRTMSPAATEKIRIVPYGCSIDFAEKTNSPVSGRVLFAGGYALRKGLRYLAQAATQLKASIPNLDVRVAGMLPSEVVNHPICKDLNFLGKLSSDEMKQEYLSADCFALPTLSEGFAGVVAEAIGAGCPVVVTRESGSPIEDGREGLVVPSRQVEPLVSALQRMLTDRNFRDQCSASCLETADMFTELRWAERLIPAVLEGVSTTENSST